MFVFFENDGDVFKCFDICKYENFMYFNCLCDEIFNVYFFFNKMIEESVEMCRNFINFIKCLNDILFCKNFVNVLFCYVLEL